MSKKPAKKTSKKAASKSSKPATKGKKASVKKVSRVPGRKVAKKAGRGGGSKKAPAASAGPSGLAARAGTLVRFAHKIAADMAAGIPDDQATAQLPGAANHKLWTLGHVAQSNQWFASLIDGQPITFPAEWDALFGMGSKPAADASVYPPIADVRAAFDASVDRLCAAIESLSDAELGSAPAGDGAGFVHDKLDSALKAAWHYGWHLGQLASLRKGLGLPSLMGG